MGDLNPNDYNVTKLHRRSLSFWSRTQEKRGVHGKCKDAGICPSLPSLTKETEHQGEDDTSEVAHCADESRHDTVIEGVAVRYFWTGK